MPAVPAMPTPENSSPWKTFSMSRWAMTLPIVARRSPAMTTPWVWTTATMVVPCGASMWPVMPAGRSRRRPGRRSGWCEARKSAKELLPGAKNARGSDPPSEGASMRSPCHEPGLIGGRGSLPASRGVEAPEVDFDDAVGVVDLGDRQAEDRDVVAMQVVDSRVEARLVVLEEAQAHVARAAEDTTDSAAVMVDVLGLPVATDGADTTLRGDELVQVLFREAKRALQVVSASSHAATDFA